MIVACRVTMLSRRGALFVRSSSFAPERAWLKGVTLSISWLWNRDVPLVSCAMTMEIPIELPMLRISVQSAVPSSLTRRQRCEGKRVQRDEDEAQAEALGDVDQGDSEPKCRARIDHCQGTMWTETARNISSRGHRPRISRPTSIIETNVPRPRVPSNRPAYITG